MAFAGLYDQELFFPKNQTMMHKQAFEEGVKDDVAFNIEFSLYVLWGILIMVALNNIFSGILGNTYDHFEGRALRLFLRQRAIFALECALFKAEITMGFACLQRCRRGKSSAEIENTQYLWFARSNVKGEDALNDKNVSLRSSIQLGLGDRLEKLTETNRQIERTLHKMTCQTDDVMTRLEKA